MENVTLSLHSIERLQQRYDIEKIEACESVADRAWRNGRTPDRFPNRMRKFLNDIVHDRNNDIVLKIHSKNCYIFSTGGKLITVYSIAERYDEYMNTLHPYKITHYNDAA